MVLALSVSGCTAGSGDGTASSGDRADDVGPPGPAGPQTLVPYDGDVVAVVPSTSELVHIDPASDTVTSRYGVPGAGGHSCRLTVGDDGDMWVISDTGVTRIRAST